MANGDPQAPPLQPLFPGAPSALSAMPAPAGPAVGAPAPNAGGMQDIANLGAQERQQVLSSAPAQEAEKARAAGPEFAAQRSATPLPQMGPHMGIYNPQTGGYDKATGGSGFLHNLGQALQMIAAATTRQGAAAFGPGGPIYGPKIAAYKEKQAGLIGQEKAAQEQASEATKEVGQLAGISKPTIMGGARLEGTREQVAEKAVAERDRHNEQLTRLEQNAEALGIKKDALNALKQYHDAYLKSYDKRTAAQEDVAMAATGARQDAAAASGINKYQELHPFLSLIGFGPEPVAPVGGTVKPGSSAKVTPKDGKPPARPKGVPSNYHWNAKDRTWDP